MLWNLMKNLGRPQPTTGRKSWQRQRGFRLVVEMLENRLVPAAFTAGNLVVYRVGDGAGSLVNTGNAVFLDEYTPAGVLVQSVALPTTASGTNKQLVASGTATSEGLLTRSSDGQYLVLTGYASNIPAGSSLAGTTSAAVPRTIGLVKYDGTIDTSTALTDAVSGNNPRSAVYDGTNLWIAGGTGGVVTATVGASTSTSVSTTVSNLRQLAIFNGQLYVSTASGAAVAIGTVGTGLPTTSGQTITNLPGIPTGARSPYSFFLADLDAGTAGVDTLYIADDGAGVGIQKYSLVSGSWVANGTITAASIRGLTATISGSTVTLYGTTGGSAAAGGGSIYTFVDSTGYNAAVTGTATTIATALTNQAFRGIALAPQIAASGTNQPPVNTLPAGPLAVTEDTPKAITGISVADADAGTANIRVTLSVLHGILNVSTSVSGGVVAGDITTNGTASVQITSTLAKINATLADATGLLYTPALNYNGSDTLTILTSDLGNTGSGGAKTDTDTLAITVSAVNDGPVNTVPTGPLSATEDTNLIVTGLSVADIDAGTSNISVTLSATNGKVTVSTGVSGGIVAADVSGNGTGSVVITSTLAKINATLADAAGVTYKGNQDFNGADTFTMLTSDLGNTGGGALTDSESVTINVSAVNDAPVNTVPAGTVGVVQNTSSVITGLSITDVDAASGLIKVTFTVTQGTLTVGTTVVGGVTAGEVATNGTASVVLTSTLAQINATLADAAGLTYNPMTGFIGPDTLTMTTDDQGNTGSGGALTDIDMVSINVTPNTPNQPPVNTLPAGPLSALEDVTQVIAGVSIADPDAFSGTIKVTFSVLNGTLSVNTGVGGGVAAGEVSGNGTATVILTSTLAKINTTLANGTGLTYQGVLNYNGPDTLTMTTNDQGNSGTGGAQIDTDTVSIDVSAVNDAPINTVPAGPLTVAEDANLVITGLSVADVEAGGNTITVTLSVANGKLTINTGVASGVTAGEVSGNGTSSVVLTSTLAQINATLADAAGVTYLGNLNYNGPDTLTMLSDDQGHAGSGGIKTDSDMVSITVSAVNDSPVNTVPSGPLSIDEDTSFVITGLSTGDADAGAANISVTLSVTHGRLTINTAVSGGVGAGQVTGNTTASVVLTGTLVQINTTLAHVSGVTYLGNPNYNGPDTLTMLSSDLGNTGSGGTKTDTDSIALTIVAVNDAPVNTVPGPKTTNRNTPLVITGISIADVDAGNGIIQVTLGASNGTMTVSTSVPSGVTAAEVTANGTGSVVLNSTLAKINITLASATGVTYTPNTGFAGTEFVTVLTNDQGNTGSGALTDNDSVVVTVLPDNLPPINTVPGGPLSAQEDVTLALNGFAVTDPDAATANIRVTFAVQHGTVTVSTVVAGGVTAGEITGNSSAVVQITSTLAKINATLASATGLGYLPALDYSGPETLTMTADDLGNTGTGGPKTDTDMVTINVAAVNDAPINTVPGSAAVVLEDTSGVVSGLSIGDNDANGNPLTVTLSVTAGKLNINTAVPGGVTVLNIGSNGTAVVTLSGSLSQLNATLAHATGVVYVPNPNFFGTDTLTVISNDLGNTGSGGAKSDTDTRTITVNGVNDGPANTMPAGPVVANEDAPRAITGITIADTDSLNSPIVVTLTVQHGTLAVSTTVPGGVLPGDVLNNGTGSVVLTTALTKINVTLSNATGLVYTPAANYAGPDNLTMVTNDVGNTGQGGPLAATSTVALTVNRVGDVVATGADKGSVGIVKVFDAETRELMFSVTPYGTAFSDGVNVALGDTNGDGSADILVTAPGKSKTQATELRVYNVSDGSMLASHPFNFKAPFGMTFKKGANLALGDLDNDGDLDLVVGQMFGNQIVALDGADGTTPLFGPIKPFGGAFGGGIRLAVGNVDTVSPGLEIAAASGAGRKGQVKVYSSVGALLANRTITFNGGFAGGLYIDVAQLNGTGGAEIVVAAGSGKPRVKIYNGDSSTVMADLTGAVLGYATSYNRGNRVALGDANDDGALDLFLAPGAGAEPRMRVFRNLLAPPVAELFSFLPQDAFTGYFVSSK